MLGWVENTLVQFSCYELRSIRKETNERRGAGKLCSIIVSRPKNIFIRSGCACRNATS